MGLGPLDNPWVFWLSALVVAAGAGAALLFLPWKINLNLQAQATPDGNWAAAGGAEFRFFVLTGIVARGVPAQVQARVLGRPIWSRSLVAREHLAERSWTERVQRWLDERPKDSEDAGSPDPLRLVGFMWQERGRIAVSRLDIHARYSFTDVALTGRMLGALHVLAAVLPPQIVVDHAAAWDFEDRLVLRVGGCIKVWVGRAALDGARYLMANSRIFKRSAVRPLKKRAAGGIAPS